MTESHPKPQNDWTLGSGLVHSSNHRGESPPGLTWEGDPVPPESHLCCHQLDSDVSQACRPGCLLLTAAPSAEEARLLGRPAYSDVLALPVLTQSR